MIEYSSFNMDQKKENKCSLVLDFFGSLGKGMLAKQNFDTLGCSSGLTPLSFGVNVRNGIMGRDSTGFGFSATDYPKNAEIFNNSSGLTPLNFDTKRRCTCEVSGKKHGETEKLDITMAFGEFYKRREM